MSPSVRAAIAVVAVVAIGGAIAWWVLLRDRVYEVPFVELPVIAGRFGLDEEPLAAEGWPACTPDLVDLRPEIGENRVSVTVRPNEDVQCALPWSPPAWWTIGDERVDAPPARGESQDPLLLMGEAGASGGTSIRLRCPVDEPVALFIELGGRPVEVGSLEDPGCGARGPRTGRVSFYYRFGGLETPAGWLDAALDAPDSVSGDTLPFVLEMTNDTDEAIPIGRCPFYDVAFVTAAERAEARSYLNCPAAPDRVRPGDVIRFQVEVPLEGVAGSGHIELELRDENRTLHRITSDEIEVVA